MGKVRECFVCSMLLARNERTTVEATPAAGRPTIVEVCVRCHARVMGVGVLVVDKGGVSYVARARPVQRQLFPGSSRMEARFRGRPT